MRGLEPCSRWEAAALPPSRSQGGPLSSRRGVPAAADQAEAPPQRALLRVVVADVANPRPRTRTDWKRPARPGCRHRGSSGPRQLGARRHQSRPRWTPCQTVSGPKARSARTARSRSPARRHGGLVRVLQPPSLECPTSSSRRLQRLAQPALVGRAAKAALRPIAAAGERVAAAPAGPGLDVAAVDADRG